MRFSSGACLPGVAQRSDWSRTDFGCIFAPRTEQALRFGRNAHGKPWLSPPLPPTPAPPAPLCFSVAHAPGALLCAVSLGAEVGCDVEDASRGSDASGQRLARRYFTAAEAASLDALPPGESRRRRFIQMWTLKEAYVKALGRGIAAAPLNTFELALLAAAPQAALTAPMRVELSHIGTPHAVAPYDVSGAGGSLAAAPPHLAQPAAWRLALLELSACDHADAEHVASVCMGVHHADAPALALRCWRTVPMVSDEEVKPRVLALGGCSTAQH